MTVTIGRRELLAALGGAAAASPLATRAQQRERMRRVGWFTSLAADDPVPQAYIAALLQGLQELGWSVGRNVRIDYRWGAANAELKRRYAAELIALSPDVIVTTGDSNAAALLQATAPCRSCLPWCLIRLGPALLRASHDPEATPLGS
jgi:putative ABC transport system substrate-binding protein